MTSTRQSPFGTLPDRQKISKYTLTNISGVQVTLIDYGATLVSLTVPTLNQQAKNIVLGFDSLEEYFVHGFFLGCTIGRVAGRIRHGKFSYQNTDYQLALNDNNRHHLHGGNNGFHRVVWLAKWVKQKNAVGVEFSYLSPDGDEFYPGRVNVKTTYWLTNDNELKINYYAETDKPTPINLTNHTYWNLAGAGSGSILNHQLELFADHYLVTDEEMISTGEIRPVKHTPYDFHDSKLIGKKIDEVGGYDVCYVFPPRQEKLHLAAQIRADQTELDVYTTQPSMQFYTGSYLPECTIAAGKTISRYSGFCLETQGFPNAVNHNQFPSIILLPGETYQHETIYQLSFPMLAE